MKIVASAFTVGSFRIDVKKYFAETGRTMDAIERTGYEYVYHLDEKETPINLIKNSIEKISHERILEAEDLICVTQSNSKQIPGMGIQVAKLINFKGKEVWDISDGCTGFNTALKLANLIFTSGKSKSALILCMDKYSDYISTNDTGTYPLFSDSASAIYVTNEGTPIEVVEKINFMQNEYIENSVEKNSVKFKMKGLKILHTIQSDYGPFVESYLASFPENQIKSENIYTHQASKIAIETLNKVVSKANFEFTDTLPGNLTSSTIPALISNEIEKMNNTRLPKFFISFGIGMRISIVKYGYG